ncbi:MAG: CBS domain-containing protein [Planctomycetota bacterium]
MSRFPLEISRYVSTVVVLVGPRQPLSEAIRLMRLHEVRHLPVVSKGRLVGLISQRDVYRMQSLDKSDPREVLVSEAMTPDPYTVEPDEAVYVVAREMARKRIGSALVTHNEILLGLFTSTDALLALAALVEDDRVPGEDDVLPIREQARAPRRPKPKTAPPRAKRKAPAGRKRSR